MTDRKSRFFGSCRVLLRLGLSLASLIQKRWRVYLRLLKMGEYAQRVGYQWNLSVSCRAGMWSVSCIMVDRIPTMKLSGIPPYTSPIYNYTILTKKKKKSRNPPNNPPHLVRHLRLCPPHRIPRRRHLGQSPKRTHRARRRTGRHIEARAVQ